MRQATSVFLVLLLAAGASLTAAELETLAGKTMQVEVTEETDTHISFTTRIDRTNTMQMKLAKDKIWRIRDSKKDAWRVLTEKKASPKKPKRELSLSKANRERKAQAKEKGEAKRTGAVSDEEPQGYPCWRGWHGDGFGSGSADLELVDSLFQAQVIWTSEAEVAGTWRDQYITGYHGAIIADGRVFFNYFMGDDNRVTPPTPACDDLILCADLATGKTLWQKKYPGGADCSPMHRIGPYSTACYADGKVFWQGSTGRVFAHDAVTGELLWQYDDLPYTKRAEAALADCIANGKSFNIGGCCMHSLQVAQGVLVASGTGFDAATGKLLWGPVRHMRKGPIRWVHKGRSLLISGNACIDPKTGQELFTFSGRVGEQSDVVGDDYLVTNGKSARPDKGQQGEGMTGFKLDLQGATKLWQLPEKYRGARGVSKVIHDGHLYAMTPPDKNAEEGQPRAWLFCVELASGTVVSEIPCNGAQYPSMTGCGRYILSGSFEYFKADPNKLEILSNEWIGDRLATCTTNAFADGLLIVRGGGRSRGAKSHLFCVDLRKNRTPLQSVQPPPASTPAEADTRP